MTFFYIYNPKYDVVKLLWSDQTVADFSVTQSDSFKFVSPKELKLFSTKVSHFSNVSNMIIN